MNLLAADIVERFYTLLLPMLRISALLLTAPPFSNDAFNVRLRVFFAAILTWLVYPLHEWPRVDPTSAEGLAEMFNQVLIGAVMGLVLQFIVAAFVVAGQALSAAMGLSMANLIDPALGNVPVLSQFMVILATLIFVGFGGHVMLIGLVLESFQTLPVGTSFADEALAARVVSFSSIMLLGGVLLALPVMVTLLFVNVGLGVVTRAAPTLNIFAVGFPALLVAGLLLMILSLDGMGVRINGLWMQGFDVVRDLLRVR